MNDRYLARLITPLLVDAAKYLYKGIMNGDIRLSLENGNFVVNSPIFNASFNLERLLTSKQVLADVR